jgi:hypothetical protein
MPLRTTHAHIYSLNGTPFHSATSAPFLRRTSSGRLFEPEQSVVKTCEKGPPVPVPDVDNSDVSRGVGGMIVKRMEVSGEEVVGR